MRKRVVSEQTPDQIIEAATRLFAQRDYSVVSVDEIADEIGLTKGGIYHYFRSKADVLVSASMATLAFFNDEISSCAAQLRGSAPQLRLLELIRAHNGLTAKHHEAFIFLVRTRQVVSELASETEENKLRALYAAYEAPFIEAIQDGISSGVFRIVDPLVSARFLLGACNWMAQWHRPEAARQLGGSIWEEQVLDVMLQGLLRSSKELSGD